MSQYQNIAKGLHTLLNETRRHTDSFSQKIQAMQDTYFINNSSEYTQEEKKQLRYYLKAATYKFYLASMGLEQLWSLSHTKRVELVEVLQNSLDKLECSDDELLLISYSLENFLFQGRAFLDFYMLYLCFFLRTGHQGSMSSKGFFKALKRTENGGYGAKAKKVKHYFENYVFAETGGCNELSPNNWGALLVSLRDKIAHRDRLRPSFDGDETLARRVLFDWPTIQRTTYDRFCQNIQNGMFSTVIKVSSIIYELDWKPGPYKPDLWLS
jgi:hypothetical protein